MTRKKLVKLVRELRKHTDDMSFIALEYAARGSYPEDHALALESSYADLKVSITALINKIEVGLIQ